MNIQTKTTLLFTLLTATVFLILSITVYYFISSFAYRDFNKRLELRARLSAKYRFEQGELSTESMRELQQQYLETLPEEKSIIVPVSQAGDAVAGDAPKELPSSYIREIIAAAGNTVYYRRGYRHFAGLLYNDDTGKFVVIGSAANRYGEEMMRQLRILKAFQFFCAVLIIYTVGRYFSKKTFQPIRHIIKRVKAISQGNLHLRLREQEGNDEIAELTSTFNQMLSRLETAFEAQNNFISHASHELRTPLTAIIGEADFALSRERTTEEYQFSLQQIAQQAEKLQVLSKGLLSLAKTGFDGKVQSWTSIRLDQLLFDVKEDCAAIVPTHRIRVELQISDAEVEQLVITGNYDLLKIAINNITLNACKYSNNKPVDLVLSFEKNNIVITVRDEGIGIPEDELKYIYDPFFRASNSSEYEGYGIGMPLANNIISLHKGRIEVRSAINRGTEVRILLPLP